MQEEVEQKSLTLTVNAAKMTARLFRAAIAKYVAHKKEKKHDAQTGVRYVGRQSVKKLVGQNQGVSNVELSGEDIKAFERVARKYGVDYAVKKVKGDAPRFLIFFKARDADALNAALFQLVAQDTTGCTKGRAPVVSVVSVGLRQRIFFLLCPFNGRDGLIHQAGVLKMGGSGLFQLCQRGLQIFRDGVVRHFPAPRHFRLRKL